MQSLMGRLLHRVTVIAMDTPGYGRSSGLKNAAGDLAVYVAAVMGLADRLALQKYAIYGSATGAQIAIETARVDRDRVSGIMLDNAAVFTDEQHQLITKEYFPDVRPCASGAHLAVVWQIAHDGTRFFPWHLPFEENRIALEFGPVETMQATAMGYLEAGANYHDAYRAAFSNERAECLAAVSVPVVVLRWAGSILRKYSDQLDNFPWGANVKMAYCDTGIEARWACLDDELDPILPDIGVAADGMEIQDGSFSYIDFGDEQLCCHAGGREGSRLVIHAPGGSALLVSPELPGLEDVMLDLPGHGNSETRAADFAQCVAAVRWVMDKLSLSSIAAVGASIAIAREVDPSSVLLMEAPARTLPDLTLSAGGGHLFAAWQWLRENAFAMHRPPPEPGWITAQLVALFQSATAYRRIYQDI